MKNQQHITTLFGILTAVLLLAVAFITTNAQFPNNIQGDAPSKISYQGYLEDNAQQPIDGSVDMIFALYSASSGGSALWQETQNSVAVSSGYFSVQLGSTTPLSSDDFSSDTRYLEVRVNTGSGYTTLPRQQLTAVPYAYQAEQASSVPWDGITNVPPGLGDNSYANYIVVAKSGGDYTSVATALASITNAADDNPYLVYVMPGEYTETSLVEVKEYVHLQGSGPNATIIVSTRTNSTQNNNAATVELKDNGRISDMTVRNEGTGTYGIALYSAQTSRDTIVDNVVAEAVGAGGTGHFAAYWNDAEATIRNSTLRASGATGFGTAINAAFGSVNISAGFPQALIENSYLLGGTTSSIINCNDGSGTGYGLMLSSSSPTVRNSHICGGHRGVSQLTNGHTQLQSATIKTSANSSAYLFEISASGSIKVASSAVSYFSTRKFIGAGTSGLTCVDAYNWGTYASLVDATNNSSTACD